MFYSVKPTATTSAYHLFCRTQHWTDGRKRDVVNLLTFQHATACLDERACARVHQRVSTRKRLHDGTQVQLSTLSHINIVCKGNKVPYRQVFFTAWISSWIWWPAASKMTLDKLPSCSCRVAGKVQTMTSVCQHNTTHACNFLETLEGRVTCTCTCTGVHVFTSSRWISFWTTVIEIPFLDTMELCSGPFLQNRSSSSIKI